MNGRTYCGHYKGYYLKSTLEFIYAKYLDYMGVKWQYEIQTFELPNGGSYKPDFYLGDHFVEIKGGFNYATDIDRIRAFEKIYNIPVKVLQEKEIRELISGTPFIYEHLRQEWKSQAKGLGMNTEGANNPRYGIAMSDSTKDKIAKKAKARMSNPSYKQKWLNARRNSPKVQASLELSKNWNKDKAYQVFGTCEKCGITFEIKFKKNKATERRFCSTKCGGSSLFSKQKNLEELVLWAKLFAEANAEEIINCKLNRIRPLLSPFYAQAEQITGIKDERTLSKALLGETTNRKNILKYLQSLAENVLRTKANNEALELEDKEPLG